MGRPVLKDLLVQAAAFEMPAVAITDHGSLFGVLDFYQKAKAAGIKPILGCKVYVAKESGMTARARRTITTWCCWRKMMRGIKTLFSW